MYFANIHPYSSPKYLPDLPLLLTPLHFMLSFFRRNTTFPEEICLTITQLFYYILLHIFHLFNSRFYDFSSILSFGILNQSHTIRQDLFSKFLRLLELLLNSTLPFVGYIFFNFFKDIRIL